MNKSMSCTFLSVALFLGASSLPAHDEFCMSEVFRNAFLIDQQGIVYDYRDVGSEMRQLGNRALPCLQLIAEQGGEALDIEGCIEGQNGCEVWAVRVLGEIGTTEARQYLVEYLEKPAPARPLIAAINMLGAMRATEHRPALLKLLKYPEPKVQAQSIVSLGALGNIEDFDAMLAATLTLPGKEFAKAVWAFVLLGDLRAEEPLAAHARTIQDPINRSVSEKRVERIRSNLVDQERILSTLRSGSGVQLYEAIQQAATREATIRHTRPALLALLEHDDPRARQETIMALAKMHPPPDVQKLLEVTLALPELYAFLAAEAFVLLAVPCAIEPLEDYVAEMKDLKLQAKFRYLVERLRRVTTAARRLEVGGG